MQESFTSSDGVSIAYSALGDTTDPVVVLCHGLGAAGSQFTDDANYFAAQGFRVIVPDLRGHGLSAMSAAPRSADFSPERLARDLIELLDHVGAKEVHWVGNSLGGILGLTLVESHPERFVTLALFGTALALKLPAAGWPFIALDYFPGRRAVAALTARTTTRNKAARPVVANMLNQYDARATAYIVDHIRRYDLIQAALNWQGPGMVMVGGRDIAVNKALLGQLPLLRARPNWTIIDLPQGGHCANLDAGPLWRQSLLKFWESSGANSGQR
ncbi:MAG: alpha/beta hydrolase [Phyllobacteriaceae bacterium]|nr:alpha/beta hydrolase [Phyllobacteriaceae bacterium]